MKVYLKRVKNNIEAIGEYDVETKTLTVLKGSRVSNSIAYTEKFRGAKTIEKHRKGNIENNVLKVDMIFKSASTAANLVTGSSTNGLVAWKTENGETLRNLVKPNEKE